MKRYDLGYMLPAHLEADVSPDGEWVRFEDVERELRPMWYACTYHEYQGLEPCPACAAQLEGVAESLRLATAVIEALPRCDDEGCDKAGTRAYFDVLCCDEHADDDYRDAPYAEALRAYLAREANK